MATAAWRDKRLDVAQKNLDKAKERAEKARASEEAAERQVEHLTGVISWLESMPVDDEETASPEPDPEPKE